MANPNSPTQPYWDSLHTQLFDFLENIDLAQSITQPQLLDQAGIGEMRTPATPSYTNA